MSGTEQNNPSATEFLTEERSENVSEDCMHWLVVWEMISRFIDSFYKAQLDLARPIVSTREARNSRLQQPLGQWMEYDH
jgi:hypothetical protein